MTALYPLTFQPLFKERVWGGRRLERLFDKRLPPGVPIGESWEISDRPADESVIANGPLAGRTLRWLMEHHGREVLGRSTPAGGNRFPLLCKILDARDRLSLQVHPPAAVAAELGGEPKTEMWYIAEAAPDAELYVGLERGMTRAEFERRIGTGEVAACFHRTVVRAGDVMFLPSGRVHAIGAGLVIFEIQQNSDTTYRVFDWNRLGLDGTPRELHVAQSLASIDFDDFEPALVTATSTTMAGQRPVVDRAGEFTTQHVVNQAGGFTTRPLVRHEVFDADVLETAGGAVTLPISSARVIAMVTGALNVAAGAGRLDLEPGRFCLVPANAGEVVLEAQGAARCLLVEPG